MSRIKQYQLWWATLPEPVGRRPVLLLTRTSAYDYLTKAIVAEVTRTMRDIPQEVRLGKREGLPDACVANLDNLHVIPLRALTTPIGQLSPARSVEVKRALGHSLDWAELKLL